jgi:hypothetical protein
VKSHWVLGALTVVNLGVLAVGLGRTRAAVSGTVPEVVRARTFQLLDERGRIRASLTVHPAMTDDDGGRHPETVLLRLITELGRPAVKIGASEEASGMSVSGPSGTKDTHVILESKGTVSSLKLRNEDERELIVTPRD